MLTTEYLLNADRDFYQANVAERNLLFVKKSEPNFVAFLKMRDENIQQVQKRVKKFAVLVSTPDTQALVSEFGRQTLESTHRMQALSEQLLLLSKGLNKQVALFRVTTP